MQNKPNKRIYSLLYISLLASITTFLIRLAGYLLLANEALLIEAVHMLVDICASAAVIFVIYLVHSHLASKYPYGLYKIDDLASLFISIIVLGVAWEITGGIFAYAPKFLFYASIVEIASIVPLAAAGYVKLRVSRKIGSPSIRSDAFHSLADSLEGLAVAIGLFLSFLLNSVIVYYIALLIALLALIAIALDLLKNSIYGILDLPKSRKLNKKVEKIISRVSKAKIKTIKLRWAGQVIFSEIVLEMDPRLSIEEAHIASDKIEAALHHSIPELESITIHIEPTKRSYFKVFIPIKKSKDKYLVNETLSAANLAATVIIRNGKVEKMQIEKVELKSKRFRGVEIAERLAESGFTDVITFRIGEMTFGVLLRHGIVIWRARSKALSDTIRSFVASKLEQIKKPTFEASWRRLVHE